MKKTLLSTLICLLGISSLFAQFNALGRKEIAASPIMQENTKLTAAVAGQIYFGYCDDEITTAVSAGSTTKSSAAIHVPTTLSRLYAGKKITKIRIGLTASSTNVSVWIRSALDGTNAVSQTVGNLKEGWTEVTLSTPFTIPASNFYIGYTATGDNQIGFSGKTAFNGCWLWYDGGEWSNYYGYKWGSLCIQALIDTQGETILGIVDEKLQEIAQSKVGENFTVPCSVTSYSSVEITSVKVSCRVSGHASFDRIIETSIAPMKSGVFQIPVDAITKSGLYNFTVSIKEINGKTNANSYNLQSEIRILSQIFPRKVVMEEFTGTWCPWCIRGVVGMAIMKEKYPDNYIGVAVHADDPITVEDYSSYMSNYKHGYPSMVVNRKHSLEGDPLYDVEAFYLSEMAMPPVAGIRLSGGFVNASQNEITVKTVTTFSVPVTKANYKLAYVLIENQVTGYDQANAYAGNYNGPMGGFENKPGTIPNMVHNDVARGIYSSPTGIDGSIPATIVELTPIEHTYKFPVPRDVQHKNRLEVAVFLLNGETGVIENADIIDAHDIMTGSPTVVTGDISVVLHDNLLFIHASLPVEQVDMYHVSGKKVLSRNNAGNIIPLGRLSAGVYIVNVFASDGIHTFKVIK